MINTDMEERDTKRFQEEGYFHVCTNGNSLPWMFKDDDDFIAGINRIGICKISTGVDVIDYTLMDNHVHFLLYGTITQSQQFLTKYKLLLGKWIQNRYNEYQYRQPFHSLRTLFFSGRHPIIFL